MPQLAGDGAGVEEVGPDGNHHVHVAGLDELAPHIRLAVAGAGCLRRHDETGAALGAKVAVEVGNPQVVAVADLLGLVHARQAKGQAAVVLHLLGVHHVDVERRIGHHEVALAKEIVYVLVEGVGLADIALQPVYGQVHLGQADGGGGLFLAEESDPAAGVLAQPLDKVARLHEHAT